MNNVPESLTWGWSTIEPIYRELISRHVESTNLYEWLSDWTRLSDLVSEAYARLKVAFDLDTADPSAEERYHTFLDTIQTAAQAEEQKLKEKLLSSGLEPAGFAVPLRKMHTEVELFRQANLALLADERKLATRYDKLIGAQTVGWDGEERTLQGIRPLFYTPDRAVRERAWQLSAARQLADREAINDVWIQLMSLRLKLAENAGLPEYRAYRWRQMLRLDYTPQDCHQFQQAIEQTVVPAATRIYTQYRQRLGVDRLRPWDLDLDLYPIELPSLPSYGSIEDLQETAGEIFRRVDPGLGDYFQTMKQEGLLDLANRKGKAPGAYSISFPTSMRPFIFMNAVGLSSDVRTLLHESGHAFHTFERTANLPYAQQRIPGLEFAEVASMAMELLASPYLSKSQGGFYSDSDAVRFRIAHLERILLFWPYMAVVDAFQHWAYTHPGEAIDPSSCDAQWMAIWRRFIPGVDWSGLEDEAMTGWHRKQHIFRYPFYYVEYGLAQLGAVQVWGRALQDQEEAVKAYQEALALGGTATLPELYAAAGASFAFDADTLGRAVELLETTLAGLQTQKIR